MCLCDPFWWVFCFLGSELGSFVIIFISIESLLVMMVVFSVSVSFKECPREENWDFFLAEILFCLIYCA